MRKIRKLLKNPKALFNKLKVNKKNNKKRNR